MKSKKIAKFMFTGVLLLLSAALLFAACSGGDKAESKVKSTANTSVNTSEKLPKMVDFKSPTCPPCRAMEPILAELAVEYDHAFELELVDVSLPENRDRAIQNSIQYIPTQIFYDPDGKQIFRHTGYYSKQDILNKWKELGYDMSSKN
ncbi:MAG: thioredoxin family protein [Candidatus Neomarinimicrobiota bacterium]|jgi:thioredoxin 1|nr:thioredoxin family protein [Candidatus Neomarinimicrobiota bacterium]MDD3966565.1 thioredoxin family protein [Candidatus Neomarinimicrobiota bacterium]